MESEGEPCGGQPVKGDGEVTRYHMLRLTRTGPDDRQGRVVAYLPGPAVAPRPAAETAYDFATEPEALMVVPWHAGVSIEVSANVPEDRWFSADPPVVVWVDFADGMIHPRGHVAPWRTARFLPGRWRWMVRSLR